MRDFCIGVFGLFVTFNVILNPPEFFHLSISGFWRGSVYYVRLSLT